MAVFKTLKAALADPQNATTLKIKLKDGAIPKDVLKLSNLEQIFIQSQNMYTLDCRHLPSSLKSLNIQDPSLTLIQDSIFNLKNLKILNLSYCHLENFSVDLTQDLELESLNLSNNSIDRLPQNIEKFSSLRILNLSKNNFETLDERILLLESIVDIDLSSNKLQDIKIDLNKLNSLSNLCLDDNPFTDEVKNKLEKKYNIWFEKDA